MTQTVPDTVSFTRLFLASGVVFGLMAVLGFGLKYLKGRGLTLRTLSSRGTRLRIVESLALDMRRRLVLVQCDEEEHLLLLGATQDLVVANRPRKNEDIPPSKQGTP